MMNVGHFLVLIIMCVDVGMISALIIRSSNCYQRSVCCQNRRSVMFPLSNIKQDINFRGVRPCQVTKRFLAASSSDLDASRDIIVGSGTKLVLWR